MRVLIDTFSFCSLYLFQRSDLGATKTLGFERFSAEGVKVM